ncbi:MAG TPA: hypothetical protein DCL61_28325 [Cyanobacteria bacterium UBA12227]|nr:hypothetical protein [Cyanobacteria bacterium UBA12227]
MIVIIRVIFLDEVGCWLFVVCCWLFVVIPNPVHKFLFAADGRDVALQRLYRVLATLIKGCILTGFGISC